MAAKTWDGSDSSWNTAGNWSPSGVPATGDTVTFDGTSVQDCTVDVAPNVLAGFTMAAGYTGTFDSNDYDLEVTGPVSIPGGGTYTKGTGTLTASGTSAQSWDLGGAIMVDTAGEPALDIAGGLIYGVSSTVVENVIVNKASNTLTLTGNMRATTLTLISGTFDPNGQAVETTGNMSVGASADMVAGNDAMNYASFTIGGSFTANGSVGNILNLRGTASWFLNVTGSATATYVDVSYSDAGAGTEINGDITCTDSLNNTNWDFAGSGGGGSGSATGSVQVAVGIAIGF